jgi:Spy/CpxP family protein refolding chaperone
MAKTWQVILATIAIFVAGLVTGGATAFGLMRWSHNHHAQPPGSPFGGRPGQPQPFGPQLMRNFEKELDLTDAQRAQIDPIVKRTGGELGRQRREVQLTTALAIEKMQDEIAGFLTPEQKVKFDELIAKQRQRFNEMREQNRAYMLGVRAGQGANGN